MDIPDGAWTRHEFVDHFLFSSLFSLFCSSSPHDFQLDLFLTNVIPHLVRVTYSLSPDKFCLTDSFLHRFLWTFWLKCGGSAYMASVFAPLLSELVSSPELNLSMNMKNIVAEMGNEKVETSNRWKFFRKTESDDCIFGNKSTDSKLKRLAFILCCCLF